MKNRNTMSKADAMHLLECESLSDLANLLGISLSALSQWPDPLSQNAENRVLAEAYRQRVLDGGFCRHCND